MLKRKKIIKPNFVHKRGHYKVILYIKEDIIKYCIENAAMRRNRTLHARQAGISTMEHLLKGVV